MDFNKIKEMGLEYAEKGRNAAMDLAERGRTQAKIVSEQTKLARAQRQLGALVYSLAKGNEENQPLVDKYIEMIGSIEANLNALKESLGPAAEVITHDLDEEPAEGGGITLSGGEEMAQWPFALELLRRMRARGVDTAIETCLLVKQDVLSRFLGLVDHFIVDIKYFDGAEHRRVLGESNELILANYRYLVEKGADVLVRTPLIPGYTATEANIRAIARFVRLTDANARYELLNFNPLCRSKYAALEEDYPVSGQPFSAGEMEAFYAILREEGIANIVRE